MPAKPRTAPAAAGSPPLTEPESTSAPQGSAPPAPELTAPRATADFAWRVHAAQESWTAKVDAKASVLLALEVALLVAAVTSLSGADGAGSRPGHKWLGLVSVVLLLLAITAAAAAVFPVVGRPREHRREHNEHVLYFGHVRLWRPDRLAERMGQLTAAEELTVLAHQLVVVSRLNWWKHRFLQVSVTLAVTGLVALAVAAVGQRV